MLANFFQLNEPFREMDERGLIEHFQVSSEVHSVLFRPDIWPKDLAKLKGKSFLNVSLSKTNFSKVTFTNCNFEDCLFIGCVFEDVEFHNCKFVNCNFYKTKHERCYIDPNSFKFNFRYKRTHSNIGVQIFQNIMENSYKEKQSEFLKKSDIQFRKWKSWQSIFDYKSGKISKWKLIYILFSSFIYDLISGYGYKPVRFILTTVILFTLVAFINMNILPGAVLIDNKSVEKIDFFDSFFYTYSLFTGLGFSYIIPLTSSSKVYSVLMAFCGIGWLSLFTSMIVKRFLR